MTNKPIKISDNCWKHIYEDEDDDEDSIVFYTKTSDPKSSCHREDGPAIKYSNGIKIWYIDGKRHRENGPAFESPNLYKEWWYNGKYIDVSSQEEFEMYIKNIIFV